MNRLILFLIAFSCIIGLSAQESQYEAMKRELNENSLPLVNLIVDKDRINKNEYVTGEIEIADYLRRTDSSLESVKFHCKYKIHGASSTKYQKKSYAVKLLDESGENLDTNLFGIREENSWILDAMAIDRIRMRNRVCFDVWNEVSKTPYQTDFGNRNGTKGEFVEVFINGEYHGLYCMTDKIDRKLLQLKKIKVEDEDITVRGLLYKGISWESGSKLISYKKANTDTDIWNAWELQYPDDYPSEKTWQPLMDLIDFCSESTSDEVFNQKYQEYFYSDNLAEYIVFTMVLNVCDNGYKNTFLSTTNITQGHRYLVSPWDMDMSLGGNWNGDYYDELNDMERYNYVAPFNRLLADNVDGFNNLVLEKWKEYYATVLSVKSICDKLKAYANKFETSGAWQREVKKWDKNPVPLKSSLSDELEYVQNWYVRNYTYLCQQFGTSIPVPIDNVIAEGIPFHIYTPNGKAVNSLQKGMNFIRYSDGSAKKYFVK
jgi:hypothetical protein